MTCAGVGVGANERKRRGRPPTSDKGAPADQREAPWQHAVIGVYRRMIAPTSFLTCVVSQRGVGAAPVIQASIYCACALPVHRPHQAPSTRQRTAGANGSSNDSNGHVHPAARARASRNSARRPHRLSTCTDRCIPCNMCTCWLQHSRRGSMRAHTHILSLSLS